MLRRASLLVCLVCAVSLLTIAAFPLHSDSYRVVSVYPHDPQAFTQGLVYVDGHLYESTGLNGRSSIRMVELSSGRVLQEYDLPAEYFGEGLTEWGGNLVQLTWMAHKGFVYERFSFSLLRTFSYEGEGWGLTHDDKQLIMSDGTSDLRFLDPRSFRETRRIHVTDEDGHPVKSLNELEYVRGEIYANVWMTDRIARISPRTGKVLGWIDLSGLIDKREVTDPGGPFSTASPTTPRRTGFLLPGSFGQSCLKSRSLIKKRRKTKASPRRPIRLLQCFGGDLGRNRRGWRYHRSVSRDRTAQTRRFGSRS